MIFLELSKLIVALSPDPFCEMTKSGERNIHCPAKRMNESCEELLPATWRYLSSARSSLNMISSFPSQSKTAFGILGCARSLLR